MAQYELNIQDYLRIFKKRHLIIIFTFISVLGSAAVFTNLQTPVYEASSTVKVEPSMAIPGVTNQVSDWDMLTALNTEVKIIKSSLVADRTAKKLGLIGEDMPAAKKDSIIGSICSKINAERVGDTNLISISVVSSDPKETAMLANAVAEVYIEKGIEDRNRRAKELREFIQAQLEDAEARLKQSEDQLKNFTETNNVKGIGGFLSGRLMDLQNRKSELLKKYTEQHPEVQRLKEQIINIEEQMRQLPKEELEYARYTREIDINEELYTLLAKRFKEAQISEADRVQSAFIITPAVEPGSPIKPNRFMNISVGAFMGIFLGFVLALVVENLDTSIGTIEDVEKYLELPVLGIIPHIEIPKIKKTAKNKENKNDYMLYMLRAKLIVNYPFKSPFVESYHTLMTNLKFSHLKNNEGKAKIISFTSTGISEGKTITASNFALAAAQSGIKTLIIESDLRRPSLHWLFGVEKSPGFSDCILGTKKWPQVVKSTTDFLLGNISTEKILQYPGIENLNLITSGPFVQNPVDMLSSPETSNIINEMSNHYELIIIDSPPVLLFADALIMGTHTSGTIIVYQVGKMARRALKRAKDQLLNIKAPVLGIILNNVKTSEMGAYYGYGYYYSYKYYSKEPRQSK